MAFHDQLIAEVKKLDLDLNARNLLWKIFNSPILKTLEDWTFVLKCMNKTPDFTNVKKIY